MVELVFRDHQGRETRIRAEAGVSLMEVAKANGIDGIVAECGGSMICGTCHVHVAEAWYSRLAKPSLMEADMLDCVLFPSPVARLSCQIEVTEDLDGLEVHIPPAQL